MDDLIQRQAVLDALHARFGVDFDWGKWWNSSHVLAAIESVPSVTPQETCGDAVSKLEVAQVLLKYAHNTEGKAFAEFLVSQINDLPPVKSQETVTEFADRCRECGAKYGKLLRQESVLDQIRAEIDSPNRGTCDYFIVDRIEKIIDKYKAESEDKNDSRKRKGYQ